MTIAPGTRLGPYELGSRIGAGGMGEVWRARDTRLDRRVAIKLLSVGFSADPQSKARFEREARTISQLEHPNISRRRTVLSCGCRTTRAPGCGTFVLRKRSCCHGRPPTVRRRMPGGRRMAAFENPAGDLDRTLGIVIYDVEAKSFRRVANDPAYALTWLTDNAIAFAARGGLTVLDLPSSTRREIRLRTPAAGARSISGSPDRKLVYIRTMRADGDLWLATLSQ